MGIALGHHCRCMAQQRTDDRHSYAVLQRRGREDVAQVVNPQRLFWLVERGFLLRLVLLSVTGLLWDHERYA
jgi:hypothetical protein